MNNAHLPYLTNQKIPITQIPAQTPPPIIPNNQRPPKQHLNCISKRLNYVLKLSLTTLHSINEHNQDDLCVFNQEINKHALPITINQITKTPFDFQPRILSMLHSRFASATWISSCKSNRVEKLEITKPYGTTTPTYLYLTLAYQTYPNILQIPITNTPPRIPHNQGFSKATSDLHIMASRISREQFHIAYWLAAKSICSVV